MAYAKIVLLLLQLVDKLFTFFQEQNLIQQGRDEEIARATTAILAKTKAGKAIMEKVNAMSDQEVDDGLRGLEPRVP